MAKVAPPETNNSGRRSGNNASGTLSTSTYNSVRWLNKMAATFTGCVKLVFSRSPGLLPRSPKYRL